MSVHRRCIRWRNEMVSQVRYLEVWLEKIVIVSQLFDVQFMDALINTIQRPALWFADTDVNSLKTVQDDRYDQ